MWFLIRISTYASFGIAKIICEITQLIVCESMDFGVLNLELNCVVYLRKFEAWVLILLMVLLMAMWVPVCVTERG